MQPKLANTRFWIDKPTAFCAGGRGLRRECTSVGRRGGAKWGPLLPHGNRKYGDPWGRNKVDAVARFPQSSSQSGLIRL